MSNFVVSGEADFSWTNKRGSMNDLPPFNTATVSETREKWLDTFRGRFGYAIDRFMVYGTAGVAVAGTEVSGVQSGVRHRRRVAASGPAGSPASAASSRCGPAARST